VNSLQDSVDAAGPPRRRISPEDLPRFSVRDLLRWIYLGRIILAGGVFAGAVVVWDRAGREETLVATVVFVTALLVTALGMLRGIRDEEPLGRGFLYGQVAFDGLMVTAIVHVTGGATSVFAALYIPVIAVAAVILPFPGVALIGAFCAILYLAEAVWGQGVTALSGPLLLQLGLFGVVAAIAGVLGDRLRRAGVALDEVESELRRLRLDTGDILASVSSGILTVDEEERMVYMNPAGEALLGMTAEHWRGASVLPRVEAVAPELAELFRRSLKGRISVFRATARAVRDGEPLTLGVTTTVREQEGEPLAVTGIFQDITDSERLAILDRQNERLEAVAELAASMAHEIKNPLASIRSAIEQYTSPRITDDDREVLSGMVVRESDRLSRLLSDFIDFTRVQVGEREEVDVEELVTEAVTVVRQHPDAEGRGVEVAAHLPPEPLAVFGDADVLHRALLNLILNAAQFSPAGEEVTVRVDDLRAGTGFPDVGVDQPVRIRVRDRGPGVPPEEVTRLFDPFYTTRKGGTGLGLAMVHRAVEAHGGAILVDRPEGGGAEFSLYLPGMKTAQPSEVQNV
jgi:two-component system, NtrC family, sensor histidine kinase PilS